MDLDLSPEHELLRRTIRDFLAREVEDQVDEHETTPRFDPRRGFFWLGRPKYGGTLLPLLCWPPSYHWGCLKTWWRAADTWGGRR